MSSGSEAFWSLRYYMANFSLSLCQSWRVRNEILSHPSCTVHKSLRGRFASNNVVAQQVRRHFFCGSCFGSKSLAMMKLFLNPAPLYNVDFKIATCIQLGTMYCWCRASCFITCPGCIHFTSINRVSIGCRLASPCSQHYIALVVYNYLGSSTLQGDPN